MKKFLFILLFVFLMGCSSNQTISSTTTPTIMQTPSLFPTQTAIPPTETLTPTLTFTPTHTQLPTWTPLPTLADEDSLLEFISFTRNSDCRLPCFRSLTPGITKWDEAVFNLRPIESLGDLRVVTNQEGDFGFGNIVSWYSSGDETIIEGYLYTIVSNDNKVKKITVSIEGSSKPTANVDSHSLPLPKQFRMADVLREYGVPSMVFIYTFIHDEPGPLPFKILLVYPEDHFYIQYYRDAKLSDNNVAACGHDFYLELDITDNKEKLMSTDAIANSPETKDIAINAWKPIEKLMNIGVEKFHSIYSSSPDECIVFPTKNWQ
jgi:hypothetical protein